MIKNMYGSTDSRFSKTASKIQLGIDALDKASQKLALEGKQSKLFIEVFRKECCNEFCVIWIQKKNCMAIDKSRIRDLSLLERLFRGPQRSREPGLWDITKLPLLFDVASLADFKTHLK